MKTICFVVPEFPAVSQTFVVNQMVGAKKLGYQVRILTYNLVSLKESSQRDLIEAHDFLNETTLIEYKIPKSKFVQLILGLFYVIKYFKFWVNSSGMPLKHRLLNTPFLIKFYQRFRTVDVFHVQFALGGTGIAEMKTIGVLGGKLITTFHGHDAHYKNTNDLKQLQNAYKLLFKESNYVTVNTPYLENMLVNLGCCKEKLFLVPMGVDVSYFKSNTLKEFPDNGEVKLISIGRLIEVKGFKYALQAVKLLVAIGLDINYTIIGSGPLEKHLQKKIEVFGLQNHVVLLGNQNQEVIRNELEMHHLYLMSSVIDSKGRSETQGVVTAEAQAMGLPVIAFNNGGIPYTLEDGITGFLVPEKDVEAYAQAILDLVNHPERYKRMSEQARHYAVANFSTELMTKRFVDLYED